MISRSWGTFKKTESSGSLIDVGIKLRVQLFQFIVSSEFPILRVPPNRHNLLQRAPLLSRGTPLKLEHERKELQWQITGGLTDEPGRFLGPICCSMVTAVVLHWRSSSAYKRGMCRCRWGLTKMHGRVTVMNSVESIEFTEHLPETKLFKK